MFQSRPRTVWILSIDGKSGTRVSPKKPVNNTANIELRSGYSKDFNRNGKIYQRLHLQVKKGAEISALRALANQMLHEVWPHAGI